MNAQDRLNQLLADQNNRGRSLQGLRVQAAGEARLEAEGLNRSDVPQSLLVAWVVRDLGWDLNDEEDVAAVRNWAQG